MNNGERQTALVTGSSRGVGLAIAKQLARQGYNLVLCARNAQALEKVTLQLKEQTDVRIICIAVDLSSSDGPHQIYNQIKRDGIDIDVLVNNAGLGVYGKFASTGLDSELAMMQVNMQAITVLTKLFLRSMLQRKQGHIINVASLAGYQPCGPKMAVYFATKNYALSFSKALSVELRNTGVFVTAVSSGPIATDFEKNTGVGNTMLYKLPKLSADQVAKAACAALESKRSVVIPGVLSKLLAFAGELHPRRIALEVNRLLLK